MSYYLSTENEKILRPLIRILESLNSRTELPASDPEGMIYILRAGANTKFPELKKWRFSKKHNHVLAIPKNPMTINRVVHNEYIDYLGIVSILLNDKPEAIDFSDAYLTEAEYNKLITTCERLEYKIEKTDTLLRISK